MKAVSVIIVDLDNTLFDWVRIWHKPFEAMLNQLVAKSQIDKDKLLEEIKVVFTKHATCEYAFLIQELPSLVASHPGEDLTEVYASAVEAYREARKEVLEMYPDVEETLQTLKDKGCLIVGYTESQAFYTNYRMKAFGLDRILDFLYSPPDHELPKGVTREEVRRYGHSHYQLRRTVHGYTPKGELKPNPHILRQIIRDLGAVADEVVYVGDSLMKDVAMAREASVADVWAKYGVAQYRPEYELLRRVTHWTAKEVAKEKKLTTTEVEPSHVLEHSFAELLDLFRFEPFVERSSEHMEKVVEAWKVSVDVQKHFNDLEMKVRNFAITLTIAIVAASAVVAKEAIGVELFGKTVPLTSVILFAAIPVWMAFYFMDAAWYHKLLLGAVLHGVWIERRVRSVLPELSLAKAIGDASPINVCGWFQIRSSHKVHLFYLGGCLLLFLSAFLALWGIRPGTTQTTGDTSAPQTQENGEKERAGKLDNEDSEQRPPENPSIEKPTSPGCEKVSGTNPARHEICAWGLGGISSIAGLARSVKISHNLGHGLKRTRGAPMILRTRLCHPV